MGSAGPWCGQWRERNGLPFPLVQPSDVAWKYDWNQPIFQPSFHLNRMSVACSTNANASLFSLSLLTTVLLDGCESSSQQTKRCCCKNSFICWTILAASSIGCIVSACCNSFRLLRHVAFFCFVVFFSLTFLFYRSIIVSTKKHAMDGKDASINFQNQELPSVEDVHCPQNE